MVHSVSQILPNSPADWVSDTTSVIAGGVAGGAGGADTALTTHAPQTIKNMNQITSTLETASKVTTKAGVVGSVVALGATLYSIWETYDETGVFDENAAAFQLGKTGAEIAVGYVAGAVAVAVTGVSALPVVAIGVGVVAGLVASTAVAAAFNYVSSEEGENFVEEVGQKFNNSVENVSNFISGIGGHNM